MKERTLRRCPFCGSPGELKPSLLQGFQKVVCSNGYCYVRPAVAAATEEKAVERWNMRSPA
jgi:hypothetical protein